MARELTAEQVYRRFEPEELGFKTTAELPPREGIVGQERALRALRFGLDIQEPGFNVYVAGPPGIGKMTAVQSFLHELARAKPTPSDWVYLHNFAEPYQPRALPLPPGRAIPLQREMRGLVAYVRRELPRAFESDQYGLRRDEIVQQLNAERNQHFERLGAAAGQAGFALEMTPVGLTLTPTQNGQRLAEQEFQALPAEVQADYRRRHASLQDDIQTMGKQVREVERAASERLRALDHEAAAYVVGGQMDDLFDSYADLPELQDYLRAVQADMLENIEAFKPRPTEGAPEPDPSGGSTPSFPLHRQGGGDVFRKYEVNVLVDNGSGEGAPVLVELNTSYMNLFGRVEKEPEFGALRTDFTMIISGALHRANGGYLVLPTDELLRSPYSWDALKRSLRAHEIEIEELGERFGTVAVKGLKPQPIPLDVKLVLVGQLGHYHLLHAADEEFGELFKVKADFDIRMDLNQENVRGIVELLAAFCERDPGDGAQLSAVLPSPASRSDRGAPQSRTASSAGLSHEERREEPAASAPRKGLHLDAGGAARLLEHALRLAEDQQKLSGHFGAIADALREARYWALAEGAAVIGADHIQKAVDEKVYRSNLIQERIQEMVARGTILIDVSGAAVGQVNGLSVLSLGDYAFGRPSRITASVGLGREGIVDIEREVQLGGPLHAKGVLILGGYLAHKYASDKPLSLDARLVFEQSYEGVEGDSASSAELYALLSALAGAPIRQEIAVTGSVNQHGEVQAIGGVNQKIEGFFDVCRTVGLTGDQGVLIPESNAQNLMLRGDVVEAIREGKFHVWAARSIDEGIELLAGMSAGEVQPDGSFPDGSIHRRVDDRLRELAERIREFGPTGSGRD